MALSTRELLARLLKCEAGGEGENGMRAVPVFQTGNLQESARAEISVP